MVTVWGDLSEDSLGKRQMLPTSGVCFSGADFPLVHFAYRRPSQEYKGFILNKINNLRRP